MNSDPIYSFSVGQKYFFVVSFKVSIFHQILPRYNALHYYTDACVVNDTAQCVDVESRNMFGRNDLNIF